MTPRDQILDHALRAAPFEGWTDRMVAQATRDANLPKGADALYFPGGALAVIAHWHDQTLAHLESEIAARGLANMRIRDRVREGVLLAMEPITEHAPAMRRAVSRLAMPDAVGQAPRQAWEIADAIWAGIGDTSTDFNYYTKRTILAGVITATTLAWLNDPDPDKPDARAFLDRRLDNVMQFEKVKARAAKLTANLPDPAELLGKLRYGLSDIRAMPGAGRPNTVRRRRRSR